MRLIGTLLVFAACQSDGTKVVIDAPDATAGSSATLGLFVAWEANPPLPGALSNRLTVADVTLQLKDLQAVGDAGNAMRAKYLLTWSSVTTPEDDAFPDAPAGVYSRITFDLGGSLVSYAYQIHGSWTDNDDQPQQPFLIEDPAPLSISVGCDATLAAASSTQIAVRVDLRDAINAIDFRRVTPRNGVLVVDATNPTELGAFRDRLGRAFKIED
jgi:hypothetical protein